MKKFIRLISFFLLILLIINGFFAIILHDIYFDQYQKIQLDSEIYLLSDSHGEALGKFDQDNIYNFSAPSDSYGDMKIKLKYLISNTSIKTLLLTVDDHILSPYREISNNSDRSVFFTSRKDYANFFYFIKEKYYNKTFVMLNSKYGTILKKYFISFFIPKSSHNEISWGEKSKKYRQIESAKRANMQFEFDKGSSKFQNDLLDIIEICESNNIQLVGVKFPLSPEYLKVTIANNYNSDSIVKHHNLRILDYEELFQNNQNYFKDQDHLNEKGAFLLKKNLTADLNYKTMN